jgi:hypothetical protein
VAGQGEAEPAADGEVIAHRGSQVRHRAPGHGWARGRRILG